VNGVPSENLTPCLSFNVWVRPSWELSQLSARAGSVASVARFTRTSRAWVNRAMTSAAALASKYRL
jgi:hypothetical protein